MIPVAVSRIFHRPLVPLQSTGYLLKNPVILRRSIISGTMGRRVEQTIQNASLKGYKTVAPIMKRSFASSKSSFNLPTRTFAFFTLSSLGIVGGFYVISYSLRVRVVVDL